MDWISKNHYRRAFRGKIIEIKILGLFWVTYKSYYK